MSSFLWQLLAAAGGSSADSHPLQQLRPMHLPDQPSAWPLAPGWWLLAATVLILVYVLSRWLINRKRLKASNHYRKQSLTMLQSLQQRQVSNIEAVAELNQLLKRCAIQAYGRAQVSGLSGENWLEFLQQQTLELNLQAAHLLINGPYLPAEQLQNIDLQPLYLMTEDWIQNHRRQDAGV